MGNLVKTYYSVIAIMQNTIIDNINRNGVKIYCLEFAFEG
jgi:hypothetical protein